MRKILLLLLIIALILPMASAASYLDTYNANRVLLIQFNGTNGGNTLTDENGKAVTNNGAIIRTNTNDWGNAAGYFSSTYATVPDSSDFAFGTGTFTILAWVNQTTVGSTGTLFCQATSGGADNAVCIRIQSGVPNFEDKTFGGTITGPAITTSGKHQIAVVRNSTYIVVYTDGIRGTPIFVGSNSTYDSANVLSFGRYGSYTGEYLVGTLDSVGMWKGAEIPIWEIWPQPYEVAQGSADTRPPDSITGLTNTTALCTEITWQWTNPGGSLNTDYAYLYTLKNDAWIGNYSNSSSAATWAGLSALTSYTFSSKTVDLSGNINATWVNRTAQTPACVTPTPTPAPTAVPGTQWCGLQSIYFNHGYAVLPAGYESLNITPPGPPEIDENVTVKASTSPKFIDAYISPQGYPGVTAIAAGTRTYNMYGYVGGAAGITRFNVTLHTRDITGLETFHYQAYSDDINDLSVALQQFSFSHPQINMATTDRIVIRVYADTDSVSDKVVHWIYQGTTHSSRVDSAYFNCVTTTPTITPTWQPEINPPTDYKADPWTMVHDWWWVVALVASLMIIFGGRR